MKKKIRRRIMWGLALVSLSILLTTGAFARAGGSKILTTAGSIIRIQDMVVVLTTGTFHPVRPTRFPDWAVPGARVSMSYYIKDGTYYYYEIVKPGEKLKIKEALEKDKKVLH